MLLTAVLINWCISAQFWLTARRQWYNNSTLSLSPSAKPSSSALSPAVKCCPVAEGQGSRGSSESAPPREPDKDAFITHTQLIARSPLLTCTSSFSFHTVCLLLSLSLCDILADIAGVGKVFQSHLWQNNPFSPLQWVCVWSWNSSEFLTLVKCFQ